MATTIAKLMATLGLDASDFNKEIGKAEDRGTNFGKVMGGMSKAGGILLGVGLAAAASGAALLGHELYQDVQIAVDSQKVQAQLQAVLKSTGGVAGVTAEKANELAQSLMNVSTFDDEAILSGENMLLTFTNIGSNVFPQATQTILDMSTALGQDLQSSAIQLGKALNDPVQGVTALRRVGVQLTDEQEAQVKSFMAVNDIASAQQIILGELSREFGGSAKAASETFGGQMTILKNQIDNIRESVGAKLIPELSKLATMLSEYLAKPETQAMIQKLADTIASFAADMIRYLPQVAEGIINTFGWLAEHKVVIVAAVSVIAAVILAFLVSVAVAAVAAAAPFIPIVAAIAFMGAMIYLEIENIKKGFTTLATFFEWYKQTFITVWTNIIGFFSSIPTRFHDFVNNIVNYFRNINWSEVGMDILRGIINGMNSLEGWVVSQIRSLGQKIVNNFKSFFGIRSPSTLMSDFIGKNLALGLNEGFASNVDLSPVPIAAQASAIPANVSSGLSLNSNNAKIEELLQTIASKSNLNEQSLSRLIRDAVAQTQLRK